MENVDGVPQHPANASTELPPTGPAGAAANRTVAFNVSSTEFSIARSYFQLLPAEQIGNISGLVSLRPDLRAFRLQLRLQLRCAAAGGASGPVLRQRLLRRLLAQRELPELSVSGDSPAAGPTELLLQAVPVPADTADGAVSFLAPLPLLAPRLTVQTARTVNIAASRRNFNFATGPDGGGPGSGTDPPLAALDLSCLGARASTFISRMQATRLSRLQRVRLRPPLHLSPPPAVTERWPGDLPPPAVLAGYRYLVQLVQTEFLEREQQQNITSDHLASPMQRMRERARLLDRAARFFYFSEPGSVYIPPDSYEKLVPERDGAGIRALPHAVYLDRGDELQFGFTVPGRLTARLVTEPSGLLQAGVDCYAAADGWQRCTASVRPLPDALQTQRRPGDGLRWVSVSLDIQGGSGGGERSDECRRRPPVPLRVAVGCPPSTTLLFNFTSTFRAAALDDKCPRCLCDRGVPCLLYSDVFQPRLVLLDWTTYQARNFTGNYTMTVLGSGYRPDAIRFDSAERRRSLVDRIWAPSVSDENVNIPDELLDSPVFPHPLLNGIKWHCGQYSACLPFVRLRFSNAGVDGSTFCRRELELVVQLYGVPTNTFVDVITMSVVFGVTLAVSLGITSAMTVHRRAVRPEGGKIVDLYPAKEQAQ
ncbi:Cation channel sperm-associated protein subunit gamma [Amphibalanus amphitrite]|uniref:Cation channel sperm-associated protein subunit gamma n=1 Tax=Amphibalanus amphitrite TaxID=1232801 RepID=A0A6A4WJE6_AMPAM|nr:Cation channel sperm-associated protein subunit gamma [Amphibalanus amphitrite]